MLLILVKQIRKLFFLNLGFLLGAILKKAFHAFNFGQINLQTFFFNLGFHLGAILKKAFQTLMLVG